MLGETVENWSKMLGKVDTRRGVVARAGDGIGWAVGLGKGKVNVVLQVGWKRKQESR